ncbi:GntR family transcriptional regulator [Paenibacillus bovis]|uniref:GntR family transcriptional regulator n=1 Tax=Paenibacillus bovis TaxID=1616788 RepID=A0A172ZGM5_9BACL|nr:GntR family transcriptional regulator [Paenibacillus bovis]ANF96689.1 GntR family transcriptional regulator [Paenibacillus bovis]
MGSNTDNLSRGKRPLYISVYDELFKQIMNGTLPAGSRLPSEPELAKRFEVSRMTLRQALALLQDDGLVKSYHGKGNFVTGATHRDASLGLEKLGNPLYKCHTETIDRVELKFRLDLESDYTQEVLGRRAAAVVAAERWYWSDEQIVAYAFTFLAIEAVSELGMDLQNEPLLLDTLEHGVYDLASSSLIEVKRASAAPVSVHKYKMDIGEGCDLLLESVHINEQYPVLYNKYYIPRQYSSIRIRASK